MENHTPGKVLCQGSGLTIAYLVNRGNLISLASVTAPLQPVPRYLWHLLAHPFQCFPRPASNGLVPVMLHDGLQPLPCFGCS